MKTTSIRLRLILWNIGILALVLTAFGISIRYAVEANISRNIDEHLMRSAHRAQGDFEWHYPLWVKNPPPPRPNFPRPHQSGSPDPLSLLHPRILDRNEQPFSFFRGSDPQPWSQTAFDRSLRGVESYANIRVGNVPVRVYSVPLHYGTQVIGVAQVVNPLTDVQEGVNRVTRALLTLIPLALLIAGIGGAFLTDRALRPVREITQAAEQIEAANLSARLPVAGRDEFSELASTFNGMLARLEGAFSRLEQAYEQQRRFTADASHELRTPLTVIKAHTSLAMSGQTTLDEYRQAIVSIDKASDRTNRLVQDLLLLARSDAGQREIPLCPVRLSKVLDHASEVLRHRDTHIVTVVVEPPQLQVLGDADALVRLFSNLLENAARHTPQGGHITLKGQAEGKVALVTVADTGEGIPPEHLPYIFERFYRVDEARSRAQGGTGLGLAICQGIVHAHDGTISVQSELGQGTTFSVTLPLAKI